jgi:hypothetical protein
MNQDDLLISKLGTNTTLTEQQQQQQIEEPALPIASEPSTSKSFLYYIISNFLYSKFLF